MYFVTKHKIGHDASQRRCLDNFIGKIAFVVLGGGGLFLYTPSTA